MRPAVKRAWARAYRAVSIPPRGDDLVEVDGMQVPRYMVSNPVDPRVSAERFLGRLPAWFDVRGKRVLDVGSGGGTLCVVMAERGAARVVGVDLTTIGAEISRRRMGRSGEELPVEFRAYSGDLRELEGERYDIVVSKDSFEHYGAYPNSPDAPTMVRDMAALLDDGGLLVIGFGPLWRSPFGGHIDTRFPWAHLIFPEEVIFDEFRRVRPPGKTARTFEEGVGVNRMSLGRFRAIMDASGLECLSFETNVSENPAVRAMRRVAAVPGLEEYFTHNAFGVWRKAASSSTG